MSAKRFGQAAVGLTTVLLVALIGWVLYELFARDTAACDWLGWTLRGGVIGAGTVLFVVVLAYILAALDRGRR